LSQKHLIEVVVTVVCVANVTITDITKGRQMDPTNKSYLCRVFFL